MHGDSPRHKRREQLGCCDNLVGEYVLESRVPHLFRLQAANTIKQRLRRRDTAISIQESLFDQVNDLAEELQIPRSQLFALAVEEFIKRFENRSIFEALNEVYDEASEPGEDALQEGMRRQQRRLVEGQW